MTQSEQVSTASHTYTQKTACKNKTKLLDQIWIVRRFPCVDSIQLMKLTMESIPVSNPIQTAAAAVNKLVLLMRSDRFKLIMRQLVLEYKFTITQDIIIISG